MSVYHRYKSIRDTNRSDLRDQKCQDYYIFLNFAVEWADSQHSFAVETYFETQESLSLTLKIFRNHFKLNRSVPLPAHRTRTSGAHPQPRKRSQWEGQHQFRGRKTSKFLKKLLQNHLLTQPEVKPKPKKIRIDRYKQCQILNINSIPTKFKLSKKLLKMVWFIAGVAVKKLFDSSIVYHMLSLYLAEHYPRELHQKPLLSVTVWCVVEQCGIGWSVIVIRRS